MAKVTRMIATDCAKAPIACKKQHVTSQAVGSQGLKHGDCRNAWKLRVLLLDVSGQEQAMIDSTPCMYTSRVLRAQSGKRSMTQ